MTQKAPRLRVEDARRKNLTRLRMELHVDWKELADLIGVSASHVSQVMSGHRGFSEKTARKIEKKLKLKPLALDADGRSHNAERVTDAALLEKVQGTVSSALSAMGRTDVERSGRYERIVEFVYLESKERGELDAAKVGRIVAEIIK